MYLYEDLECPEVLVAEGRPFSLAAKGGRAAREMGAKKLLLEN